MNLFGQSSFKKKMSRVDQVGNGGKSASLISSSSFPHKNATSYAGLTFHRAAGHDPGTPYPIRINSMYSCEQRLVQLGDTFDPFQKFKTPEAQARNSWMVHHLNIRFAGVLECFARPLPSSITSTLEVICTNLRTLRVQKVVIKDPEPPFQFRLLLKGVGTFPFGPLPPIPRPKPEPLCPEKPRITDLNLQNALSELIKSNPGLQHLAAGQDGMGVHNTLDREPLLQVLTAEYLPKLEVLELFLLYNTPPRVLRDQLERCSERIKRLQIQRTYEPPKYEREVIAPPYDTSDLPARGHVCLNHSALESLSVRIAMKRRPRIHPPRFFTEPSVQEPTRDQHWLDGRGATLVL